MPDREKVIAALRNCVDVPQCRDCPWDDCDAIVHETVEDVPRSLLVAALDLLKAQEPVAPKIHNGGGKSVTWWYVCGACEHAVSPGDKYCGNCGKAVKWVCGTNQALSMC